MANSGSVTLVLQSIAELSWPSAAAAHWTTWHQRCSTNSNAAPCVSHTQTVLHALQLAVLHIIMPDHSVLLQVLKNPSVPFQEGRSVDAAMLEAKGVKPYGPPVDVWAAGVLAYELVCGRHA